MSRVFSVLALQLLGNSLVYAQMNDSHLVEGNEDHAQWEMDFVEATLDGDTNYTVTLQQSVSNEETYQTQCMGVIIDDETIVTSRACRVAGDSTNLYRTAEIIPNTLTIPLATQVLRVDPPMILSHVNRPPVINANEEYNRWKNQDVIGIVVATNGSTMTLVRWYDQMKKNEGGKSVCEEKYLAMQQKHPEWPESLPEGIFCVRGGNQEDTHMIGIKRGNVTIEAGLPCKDSTGSPILLHKAGLLGVVTAADCESKPQIAFAQSMAYVETHRNNSTNQTTKQPQKTITATSMNGTPPAVYPIPQQYLGPVYIKVIQPTPSAANHNSDFWFACTGVIVSYYSFTDSIRVKL